MSFLPPIVYKDAENVVEKLFEAFLLLVFFWDVIVYLVSIVKLNAEQRACYSQNELEAADTIRLWIQTWTKSCSDKAAAQLDEDGNANIDSSKNVYAIENHAQVPICNWFANTYISGTKLKINEAAKITHLSCNFIAHISVEGVLMVRNNNFCRCLHVKEVSRVGLCFTLK